MKCQSKWIYLSVAILILALGLMVGCGSGGGLTTPPIDEDTTGLPAPTGVSASDGTYTDKIYITWNSVTGASYYKVWRATSSGGTKTAITSWQSSRYYSDYDVIQGDYYYYFVKAAASSSGANASPSYSSYNRGHAEDVLPEPEATHYEGTSDSNGVATFTLQDGQVVQAKVIDVVTGEPIRNIESYLVTDGTRVAFLFVDKSGIYIPRIAPEGQSLRALARSPEERQIGTIKELWKMGVDLFSGYEPKFADQIDNRLASYMFKTFFMFCYHTPLSELQFNLKGFLQDYVSDFVLTTAICALTKIVAVYSVPVVGQVLAIVGVIELGNTVAYELWVRYYKSRGYSLGQMFEIWRLNPIIAGLTVIPFVFPIEEPSYPPPEENPGSISGKVLTAQTAEGIYYAQVQIVDLDLSTTTSSDGSYSFNGVPPGTYGIVATKAGYYPSVQINATVISGATATDVNLVLSSILTSTDEYRIVLTWGENPRDLDSHLWIPNGEHCYYSNKTVSGANLDVDDVSSYGPETITITEIYSGTYTYAVKHYSGSGKITTSGATVKIYNDSGNIRTYEVDPNASCGDTGWYWTVFELDGNSGAITNINTFNSSSPRYINDEELLPEKKVDF